VIKVMVVEDNDLVRDALVELLDTTPSFEVVAACSDGSQALEAARANHPDVVLMDIMMPKVDGLEATRQLLSEDPASRIVVLTGSFTVEHVVRAHELGAAGFLLKDGDPTDLPDAIRRVAEGGTAWSDHARTYLAQG
jgi:DNA-binding NarL/FixJ family response regulator